MNAYFGADTEALRTVSSAFARRADLLSEIESQILAVIDGTEWIGEDAEAFRADWAGRVRPVLQDCSVDIRHSARRLLQHAEEQDRKSTRLNSSHVAISYAVFCLKKKNTVVREQRGEHITYTF